MHDYYYCEICGAVRNLDRHHLVPKGMGSSKDPAIESEENLIWLCRECHRSIHEGRWHLEQTPQSLKVYDRKTGELVMRRFSRPGFDAPSFFEVLNTAEHSMASLLEVIPLLTDDQLVEAYGCSRSLGKKSWLVEAAILYEAQQRSAYNDHALEGIARRFEISLRHAQKYALIWRLFFANGHDEGENVNVDAFLLDEPSWYVVAATESPEPHQWLAYAQDRKVQDPRYSVSAFRRDIRVARMLDGIGDVLSEVDEPLDSGSRWELWQGCPWVRLYCIHSGRPVPVGQECATCEFRRESETPFLRNEPILDEDPETTFFAKRTH